MSSNSNFFLKAPLPQVGAVLAFDSELVKPDVEKHDFRGHRHWKLIGSCVLVAPSRILTLNHVFQRSSPVAVFVPYEGLFALGDGIEQQGEHRGDNLILCSLKPRGGNGGQLPHVAKLHPPKEYAPFQKESRATACGFGQWPTNVDFEGLNGLQQRHSVRLEQRRRKHWTTNKYDVFWSSEDMGNLEVGRHNSGGPLFVERKSELSVIGLIREKFEDLQIASWMDGERKEWLREELKNLQSENKDGFSGKRFYQDFSLDVGDPGALFKLELPSGTKRVQATLNASDGIRLQMKIGMAEEANGFLQGMAAGDAPSSGRFLYEELILDGQAESVKREVLVGVVPSPAGPPKAQRVIAQLSVLLLGKNMREILVMGIERLNG